MTLLLIYDTVKGYVSILENCDTLQTANCTSIYTHDIVWEIN